MFSILLLLLFSLLDYMLSESYGGFYREPQEENKALTIDKKLMSALGSLQVLKHLVFYMLDSVAYNS